MDLFQTSVKLRVISDTEEFVISDNKKIKFGIFHNKKLNLADKYSLIMAKYVDGNFSVAINNFFLQTFSGDYFFFLYGNDEGSEYVLNFSSLDFILGEL